MVHPFELLTLFAGGWVEVLATGDHSAGVLSEIASTELFELWEQRYGTADGRAPSFPASSEEPRTHRFGEAERRRRRSALAEWVGGVDAGAELQVGCVSMVGSSARVSAASHEADLT